MSTRTRRHDIDWLRVLAMFAVFFFHCARFFSDEDWHIKNNQLDFGMSVFVGVLNQWMMPLFFVLSAIGAYYALGRRTARQYLVERLKRLVVPLVFGTFVLIPPQVYIERVSHGQFSGSFVQFLPRYFDGLYAFGGNFAWMGLHLWYLEILFVFSLLTLPLFRYLRSEGAQRWIAQLADWARAPGAVLLPVIPLAVVELLVGMQPAGIGRRDFGSWSLVTYLAFFVLGYLVACDERFQESIERHRIVALVGSLITTAIAFFLIQSGRTAGTLPDLLRVLNAWLWLLWILGFGGRHLRFSNQFLRYASEAVLPFYILHQTVIVFIGFLIADWDASVALKYLVLGTTSFVVIVALYELAIKRVSVLRFLFGMKPHQAPAAR
jgi:peptidoglycan/LPS O-acetylase OafA/YrhL